MMVCPACEVDWAEKTEPCWLCGQDGSSGTVDGLARVSHKAVSDEEMRNMNARLAPQTHTLV